MEVYGQTISYIGQYWLDKLSVGCLIQSYALNVTEMPVKVLDLQVFNVSKLMDKTNSAAFNLSVTVG